jgi:hypothetical protein
MSRKSVAPTKSGSTAMFLSLPGCGVPNIVSIKFL